MADADFDFFEALVGELSGSKARVLTRRQFEIRMTAGLNSSSRNASQATLLDDLLESHHETSLGRAIEASVRFLDTHFRERNGVLPFSYNRRTGLFSVRDAAFLTFVEDVRALRSVPAHGRAFELAVLNRLSSRARGTVHRVGHPRDVHRRNPEINRYLHEELGFEKNTLAPRSRDGGFDLIWALPLGALPYRPLALIQCKNGSFDWTEADHSVMSCDRSMQRHRGLGPNVHMHCVMFNGYITPGILPTGKMNYVPLGISDLSRLLPMTSSVAV